MRRAPFRTYGKVPPVLVIQDDRFDATDSITICSVTSDPTEIPLLRIPLEDKRTTGLSRPSSIMVTR
ncbi:MAG: type II toxin-antitoxin system PemK/MazF family toxin [Sciscionella sp.]